MHLANHRVYRLWLTVRRNQMRNVTAEYRVRSKGILPVAERMKNEEELTFGRMGFPHFLWCGSLHFLEFGESRQFPFELILWRIHFQRLENELRWVKWGRTMTHKKTDWKSFLGSSKVLLQSNVSQVVHNIKTMKLAVSIIAWLCANGATERHTGLCEWNTFVCFCFLFQESVSWFHVWIHEVVHRFVSVWEFYSIKHVSVDRNMIHKHVSETWNLFHKKHIFAVSDRTLFLARPAMPDLSCHRFSLLPLNPSWCSLYSRHLDAMSLNNTVIKRYYVARDICNLCTPLSLGELPLDDQMRKDLGRKKSQSV